MLLLLLSHLGVVEDGVVRVALVVRRVVAVLAAVSVRQNDVPGLFLADGVERVRRDHCRLVLMLLLGVVAQVAAVRRVDVGLFAGRGKRENGKRSDEMANELTNELMNEPTK